MNNRIKKLLLDNPKFSFLEAIWESDALCFVRRIGRFTLRIIRWIPVLWKQEEWDSEYIYDILKLKMLELKEEISKDKWHEKSAIETELKQINICLARLDRYLNWIDYCDYPIDDISFVETEEGLYKMEHSSEENEIQRQSVLDFEEKNLRKFWKNFVKWHSNWWT